LPDILSQTEIEALLNTLTEGEAEAGSPAPSQSAPGADAAALGPQGRKNRAISYEVYDFRRPDKFSKDQLRTLQMLHESFARMAGTGLSAFVRSPVSIELISLEQVPYEEYIRTINQSVFTIVSLPPLTGQAVLEIEFSLIFSMVDKLLGGPGRPLNRTVLTDIEKPLVRQTVERMFTALKSAWEGVVIVNPGVEGMETSTQFVQIAPPSDIVVTMLFEIKMGSVRGAMSICVPYLVLKPITAKLSAQKWIVSSNRKRSPAHRRLLSHQVQNAAVECSVRLGQRSMTVRRFLSLRPGDTIVLDQRVADALTLLVSQTPKFEGRAALNGKRVVFTVSNALTSG
jgi:flagellar motor switch protein FliM